MNFFFKCISLFVGLIIILFIVGQLFLEGQPTGAILLYSTMISLMATLIYGWIDGVYINPESE